MNKKTAILAMVALLTLTGALMSMAEAETYQVTQPSSGYINFTSASDINGGLQPGMIVSVNLPPYDGWGHVASVSNGMVTFQEGTITTPLGIVTSAPLSSVFYVWSPYYPGSLPTSLP